MQEASIKRSGSWKGISGEYNEWYKSSEPRYDISYSFRWYGGGYHKVKFLFCVLLLIVIGFQLMDGLEW